MNCEKNGLLALCIAVAFSVCPSLGYSEVNPNNGNFSISYVDLKVDGAPIIVRTYNSKSTYSGMFGYGWSSLLETFLVIGPEGAPVVHMHGGGGKYYYEPAKDSSRYEMLKNQSLQELVQIEINEISSEMDDVEEFRQVENARLLRDRAYRTSQWLKHVDSGLLQQHHIPVGSEFFYRCTCVFDSWFIEKLEDGYRQHSASGEEHFFDEEGRLSGVKIEDWDVAVHYEIGNERQISHLLISKNGETERLTFLYGDNGFVERITDSYSVRFSLYEYSGQDLNVGTDADKNKYIYSYDGLHNMTLIEYVDRESMEMMYDSHAFIRSIKYSDGSIEEYDLGWIDPDTQLSYYTEYTKKPDPERPLLIKKERFEWYKRLTEAGVQQTVKTILIKDGIERSTIFNEDALPIQVILEDKYSGKRSEIAVQMDEHGRVEELSNGKWQFIIRYWQENSELVVSRTESAGADIKSFGFGYDQYDRLKSARHAGIAFSIEYQSPDTALIEEILVGEKSMIFSRSSEGALEKISFGKSAECRVVKINDAFAFDDCGTKDQVDIASTLAAIESVSQKSNFKLLFH